MSNQMWQMAQNTSTAIDYSKALLSINGPTYGGDGGDDFS